MCVMCEHHKGEAARGKEETWGGAKTFLNNNRALTQACLRSSVHMAPRPRPWLFHGLKTEALKVLFVRMGAICGTLSRQFLTSQHRHWKKKKATLPVNKWGQASA